MAGFVLTMFLMKIPGTSEKDIKAILSKQDQSSLTGLLYGPATKAAVLFCLGFKES